MVGACLLEVDALARAVRPRDKGHPTALRDKGVVWDERVHGQFLSKRNTTSTSGKPTATLACSGRLVGLTRRTFTKAFESALNHFVTTRDDVLGTGRTK